MSDAIVVENLSKQYIISHQPRERYTALRDVLANGAKSFAKKLAHPFAQPEDDPTHETFWALKDINFTIQQGDRVGIIGRNGAGKSTLLKILSRITEPTSGRIKIRGRVASLLEVGTGFHPELTGRENIFLNGAILGMSKAEIARKFDEIVAFAEVEKFLDTPVKRYSSGMYVRLAFAVAAHLEPEILIVDEVLAVGDAQFQKKCLGRMEEVSKQGRTILFVSHNLAAVRTLCNRALILKGGVALFDGDVNEGITTYLQAATVTALIRDWVKDAARPENASVVLERVAIRDKDGRMLTEVYTDTAFNVEIEYRVKQRDASAGFTVVVYDNDNNCVFSSIGNQEPNWYGKQMPVGRYRTVCEVPGEFFNNGVFRLTLIFFGKGFSDAVIVKDVLQVEILDGPSIRGDFFGIMAGVVRPRLRWVTLPTESAR